MTKKTMIQAKARALAVDLILHYAPTSVDMHRRGLTNVHGEHVVAALEEELADVRSVLEQLKTTSAHGRATAQLAKTRGRV